MLIRAVSKLLICPGCFNKHPHTRLIFHAVFILAFNAECTHRIGLLVKWSGKSQCSAHRRSQPVNFSLEETRSSLEISGRASPPSPLEITRLVSWLCTLRERLSRHVARIVDSQMHNRVRCKSGTHGWSRVPGIARWVTDATSNPAST